MTNLVIPAEAVEAAARVMFKAQTFNDWEPLDPKIKAIWTRKARAALEAAAPHMLAAAWGEGHKLGQSAPFCPEPNPYRTPDAR